MSIPTHNSSFDRLVVTSFYHCRYTIGNRKKYKEMKWNSELHGHKILQTKNKCPRTLKQRRKVK